MYSLIKQFIVISMLCYASLGFSKTLTFKSAYYPTTEEVTQLISHGGEISMEICCYYPDMYDYMRLKKLNLKSLKVTAGYFPTKYQMNLLDRLSDTKVSIEVSEVFPNEMDHRILNESNVDLVIINSNEYPTAEEVGTYNKIKKNVRINFLHREYPLPKHMKHIKKLNNDFTVAFFNKVPPGPGYANFFNDLKTNKVFVIIEQFPYGMDAVGINMLTKSKIEVIPNEKLMPQDVEILNQIKLETMVSLKDQYPLNEEFFNSLLSIEGKLIKLEDNGTGDLLDDQYDDIFSQGRSKIEVVLPRIL